ncbi:glucose-6-phosphate isomerase [Patescibacteria group bacterium]|nr:glucose-6-phosphate isomerase [Patescibacteria group bacterium]
MEINLKDRKSRVRLLSDIKKVVFDQEWLKTAPDRELYFMYGDVINEGDFKYSVTVLPPFNLGKEFVKTKGHVHIGSFQETYTVLEGEAIYLMQKGNELIEDVYAVFAKKGESIIIPSGYGHITINASNLELKTGDWRYKDCKSDYSLFERLGGACYYYTKNGWVKNKNYKQIPEIRFEEPLKSLPEDLSFLKA